MLYANLHNLLDMRVVAEQAGVLCHTWTAVLDVGVAGQAGVLCHTWTVVLDVGVAGQAGVLAPAACVQQYTVLIILVDGPHLLVTTLGHSLLHRSKNTLKLRNKIVGTLNIRLH